MAYGDSIKSSSRSRDGLRGVSLVSRLTVIDGSRTGANASSRLLPSKDVRCRNSGSNRMAVFSDC